MGKQSQMPCAIFFYDRCFGFFILRAEYIYHSGHEVLVPNCMVLK